LGNEDAAHCPLATLTKHGICAIVIVGFGLTAAHPNKLKYLQLKAIDLPIYDISQHLAQACHFITNVIALKTAEEAFEGSSDAPSVLIHCARGKSRSAAIAVGYLMWVNRISFAEAHARVRKCRDISINSGFQNQLQSFEKSQWRFKDGTSTSKAKTNSGIVAAGAAVTSDGTTASTLSPISASISVSVLASLSCARVQTNELKS